jgi:hypothetical protein
MVGGDGYVKIRAADTTQGITISIEHVLVVCIIKEAVRVRRGNAVDIPELEAVGSGVAGESESALPPGAMNVYGTASSSS